GPSRAAAISTNGSPKPESMRAPGGRIGSSGSRRRIRPRFRRASPAAESSRRWRTRREAMLKSGIDGWTPPVRTDRALERELSSPGGTSNAPKNAAFDDRDCGLRRQSSSRQEPTGTLKKIKDTGAITLGHRESSVPFSYYDDKQQVVGYAMDLCARIVDGV